ncbi:hypothetical protein GN956_G17889 [Arapaima gigas]
MPCRRRAPSRGARRARLRIARVRPPARRSDAVLPRFCGTSTPQRPANAVIPQRRARTRLRPGGRETPPPPPPPPHAREPLRFISAPVSPPSESPTTIFNLYSDDSVRASLHKCCVRPFSTLVLAGRRTSGWSAAALRLAAARISDKQDLQRPLKTAPSRLTYSPC